MESKCSWFFQEHFSLCEGQNGNVRGGRLLSQNALLDKYNEYLTVVGYSFEYEFDDGSVLVYTLKKKNFPHLIGCVFQKVFK